MPLPFKADLTGTREEASKGQNNPLGADNGQLPIKHFHDLHQKVEGWMTGLLKIT